jgi:hypothetical protein
MTTLSKEELKRQIRRFLLDKDRGISVKTFAEACGLSSDILEMVFLTGERQLTEHVQRRVNIAYDNWRSGYLRTMRRRDRTTFADYRRQAEVPMLPSNKIVFKNGQFSLVTGLKNRHDYSEPTLDEQLNKKA